MKEDGCIAKLNTVQPGPSHIHQPTALRTYSCTDPNMPAAETHQEQWQRNMFFSILKNEMIISGMARTLAKYKDCTLVRPPGDVWHPVLVRAECWPLRPPQNAGLSGCHVAHPPES